MPYDSSTGIITAPVSIRDVQRALGTSRHYLNELCTHQNVNLWSKYKPKGFNQIDTTKHPTSGRTWLDSNNKWNGEAQWWKYRALDLNNSDQPGKLFACGFYIPYTDTDSMAANTNIGAWTFQKPTGGASSPYRLTDFNEYCNKAICPFGIELPTEVYWGENNKIVGKAFTHIYSGKYPDYNLSLTDLLGNNAKLAIAVIKNANSYRVRTQEGSVVSLEGLEASGFLSVGDTFTIAAFATTSTVSSWSGDSILAYSLHAPNISFSLIGSCVVKPTLTNKYHIDVQGLASGDFFRVVNVVPVTGPSVTRIVGDINRTFETFSKSYILEYVVGKVAHVDANGVSTDVYTETRYPDGSESFMPEEILRIESTSYRQLSALHFLPKYNDSDPSAYYDYTYTFKYK